MNAATQATIQNASHALVLENISKRFQKKRGVYANALTVGVLEITRGEVVGILGPNGSGKSTLVRVVSTLTLPDEGSVHIFDIDAVQQPRIVQRYINRVSVEASFFKKLSSMENLIFGSKLYGIPDRESKPRIAEILTGIGFDIERVGEPMEHLSRGMQQKIALARALLTSPMLMLLDEPTTGLDPRSKRDVQLLINRDPFNERLVDSPLHPRYGRSRGTLRPDRDSPRRKTDRHRHTAWLETAVPTRRHVAVARECLYVCHGNHARGRRSGRCRP